MRKTILLLYLLSGHVTSTAFAATTVAFTPSSECESMIIEQINKAQLSIDAAVYTINNPNIVTALLNAHKRRVKVRILTDKLQAANKYSLVPLMYKNGLNIKVNSKYKIEHNKFAVFDYSSVITGSFNWTNAASQKNSENCLLITDEPQTLNAYQTRFEHLWLVNLKSKSDNWFEKYNK